MATRRMAFSIGMNPLVILLIQMDIQLPVMSGIEATKEIRRLERVKPHRRILRRNHRQTLPGRRTRRSPLPLPSYHRSINSLLPGR